MTPAMLGRAGTRLVLYRERLSQVAYDGPGQRNAPGGNVHHICKSKIQSNAFACPYGAWRWGDWCEAPQLPHPVNQSHCLPK